MGRVFQVENGGEGRVCRIGGMVGMGGEEVGGIEGRIRLSGAEDVHYCMQNECFTIVSRTLGAENKISTGLIAIKLCKYQMPV